MRHTCATASVCLSYFWSQREKKTKEENSNDVNQSVIYIFHFTYGTLSLFLTQFSLFIRTCMRNQINGKETL